MFSFVLCPAPAQRGAAGSNNRLGIAIISDGGREDHELRFKLHRECDRMQRDQDMLSVVF